MIANLIVALGFVLSAALVAAGLLDVSEWVSAALAGLGLGWLSFYSFGVGVASADWLGGVFLGLHIFEVALIGLSASAIYLWRSLAFLAPRTWPDGVGAAVIVQVFLGQYVLGYAATVHTIVSLFALAGVLVAPIVFGYRAYELYSSSAGRPPTEPGATEVAG